MGDTVFTKRGLNRQLNRQWRFRRGGVLLQRNRSTTTSSPAPTSSVLSYLHSFQNFAPLETIHQHVGRGECHDLDRCSAALLMRYHGQDEVDPVSQSGPLAVQLWQLASASPND